MPSGYAIEFDEVSKSYDGVAALRELTLRIERGQVFGFLGPNGAGKTTTLRIVTTLLEPTTGAVTVLGRPTSDRDAVRERIGYLPESPPIYEKLTGREQLRHAARLRGVARDDAERRIQSSLDRFDLLDAADERIDTYSTGMRQKVGIVQSMLHEPEVLILDEPTSGLDPAATRDLRNLLDELAESGVTVVLSTHVLSIAEAISDTVGVLDEGELIAHGEPAEILRSVGDDAGDEDSLEDAFLKLTDSPD